MWRPLNSVASARARLVCALRLAGESRRARTQGRIPDHYFYNNEFDEAIAYFEQQVKAHPNDPDQYNHLAQSILYREMLRDGALESQLVTGNNPFLAAAEDGNHGFRISSGLPIASTRR